MDDLSLIAGCGPTIRLGGETVIVQALRLRDYGTIVTEILRRRGNPFDLLRRLARRLSIRGCDADRQKLLARLLDDVLIRWCRVGFRDVIDWLNTWPGRVFALWLSVRDADPRRYTFEWIVRSSQDADWPGVLNAMEQAAGDDERTRAGCGPAVRAFDAPIGTDEHVSPIPWGAIYRRLTAHPFAMSAADVGNLTLEQLRLYLAGDDGPSHRLEFSAVEELESWRRRRMRAIECAVANLRRGARWDERRVER